MARGTTARMRRALRPHNLYLTMFTMSHMYLILCKTRGDTAGVGFHQDGRDRVDPSPRDSKSSTCVISTLSDRDRRAHRSQRGATRSARSSSGFDQGFIGCGFIGRSRSSSRSSPIGRLAVDPPYDRGILYQVNRDRPLT